LDDLILKETIDYEVLSKAHQKLMSEVSQNHKKSQEFRHINHTMVVEENQIYYDEQLNTNDDLAQVRNLIEMEAAQRCALEQYVLQLRAEIINLHQPEQAQNSGDSLNDEMVFRCPFTTTGNNFASGRAEIVG